MNGITSAKEELVEKGIQFNCVSYTRLVLIVIWEQCQNGFTHVLLHMQYMYMLKLIKTLYTM